jgi:N-acetyl-alpha-D-glucosaminyl L-malate synthase BshA
MKIAILTYMFPPDDVGGIEVASQDIANRLAQNGDKVFVITSGKRNIIENPNKNVTVYRFSNLRIKFLGSSFFWFIFWIKIFFLLKKIKPDIVHCQAIQMGVPGFLFKKFYKKPYIVWCHGFDVYFPWKFKKIISNPVLNSADAIVALTSNMKDELNKTCKKDILVLPNGIDLENFSGLSKQSLRDKFKINPDEKIIIFVGGLKPVKGIEYLIEAFWVINQKIPASKLFLVGEGIDRINLENAVKKNNLTGKVNFTGKIANREIPEYMALSDIFVLPSLSEGFGIVNLEAMACGLPIVATNVGGIPEVIKDGENGFIVEPKNPGQIAEKVLLLLEDEKLREKISNNNREEVKKYSLEIIVNRLMEIYLSCLKK